ncbi:MAG: cytidylate kinase family protein [Patescibacteria group bacterium]
MRIILSGDLGAGKTTVSALLAQKLGFTEYYTGGIFREMAEEVGKTIEEFYAEMKDNPELERTIDAEQERIIRKEDNIIVQGRIAAFLAPETPKFKVFFVCNPEEAAKRIQKLPKYNHLTIEEIVKLNEGRVTTERERYRLLYPYIENHLDESKFDLVIETSFATPAEVCEIIITNLPENLA